MIVTLKDGFLPLESLKELLDISRVKFYTLKEKDGCVHLKFYDSKRKVIKPYAKEKSSKSKTKMLKK